MNKYESIIIIKPNLKKSHISKIILKIEDKIKEYSKIIQKEDLGIKHLAYEIRNNKEGHYISYQFELNENIKDDVIKDIEHFYKITDEVIKYIVVKI